jgi:hypothetical protein
VTLLRRDIEAVNARLDRMQEETNARFDQLQASVAAILAAVAQRSPPPAGA